ncbi:MAG: peptidoglycan-binding protein [Candidatus Omnitrophica bacterium]|nr:peptidoglycan-binding protein [Candidatus Omnitrophota bacterium]
MHWSRILLLSVVVFSLAGCATARKDVANLETQQLKARISELETELSQKDEEINYLEGELFNTQKEKQQSVAKRTKTKSISEASRPTPKRIQLALKNAGFYKGPVDGKIGQGTKTAIKQFQKAQGIKADGIVGKQTWLKLKKHLN